ncbi:hypothetical protein RPHASCH2410_PD04810 (plasmid) [Rhizobium phaseoli Ch24-10]|nr:hypothetical protein RPHASCH2410_PD04810 [Rhizobium phaseoli Ch24-10]
MVMLIERSAAPFVKEDEAVQKTIIAEQSPVHVRLLDRVSRPAGGRCPKEAGELIQPRSPFAFLEK